MINKLNSFSLIFCILLSCLEWIEVLNCQQNINYLDDFLSDLINLYHDSHLNLCHLSNFPWIWTNTVGLHNLWTKITGQVMLLPLMPAKESFTLNIYFIFQEVLKSRNCSFGIDTVIFWYLIMTPPGMHYCECFSFSRLLSYKKPASCLYIIIIWCLLKLLFSDPRQILWPGVIRFSLIYKNDAVQF